MRPLHRQEVRALVRDELARIEAERAVARTAGALARLDSRGPSLINVMADGLAAATATPRVGDVAFGHVTVGPPEDADEAAREARLEREATARVEAEHRAHRNARLANTAALVDTVERRDPETAHQIPGGIRAILDKLKRVPA